MKTILFHSTFVLLAFINVKALAFNGAHLCFANTSIEVPILSIEGVINPLSARYLKRELTQATENRAEALILELNTPGGLESSMREISQSILSSTIPVIVFVSPAGARAASAGMFITLAGNIAAMTPGTTIGAAHPVRLSTRSDQESGKIMERKIVNDAAAFARSIAKLRNRNMTWVEQAVLNSDSLAAHEALKMNVIDLIASDLKDLLTQLDGKSISLPSRVVTLQTRNIQLVRQPMRLPEQVFQLITNPNIAYLLITVGFLGVIAEFFNPGLYLPGITGFISLLLGFTAMGSLPLSWAGLTLLILGVVLFVVETHVAGFGLFGIAGFVAFISGSLLLYTPLGPVSPAFPLSKVSLWIVGGVAFGFLVFFLFILKAVVAARRLPIATGRPTLVGKLAIAVTDLTPKGVVKLNHERWSAIAYPESQDGMIHAGETVEVMDLEGAVLKVRRLSQKLLRTRSQTASTMRKL